MCSSDLAFKEVVVNGVLLNNGMPKFNDLSDQQLKSLRHFIRHKAREPQVLNTGQGH